MLTAIRVTDWIAIGLFLAGAAGSVYVAFQGHPWCWAVAAGLAGVSVLLALHRIRRDGGGR